MLFRLAHLGGKERGVEAARADEVAALRVRLRQRQAVCQRHIAHVHKACRQAGRQMDGHVHVRL